MSGQANILGPAPRRGSEAPGLPARAMPNAGGRGHLRSPAASSVGALQGCGDRPEHRHTRWFSTNVRAFVEIS